AQTGTGKTAAFGLPILQNLEEGFGQTQALILAPTRELAIQVANEISSFKGRKRFNVVTVYGGQPIMTQIRDLNKGADIVVGTPGRVIDLMKRGKLRVSNVEYFILDEADEMLNMGFIDDIEWIMEECNDDKQMLLFSATMPNKIKKLAHKYMPDYKLVAVKSKEVTTKNTEQLYYPVFPKDRFKVLERILLMEPDFYGIIFSNTKLTADDITRKLLKDGIKAEALHGDIAQNQRERILKRFKDKQCTVLVATDVAARGIDVNDLTHVINYGLPQDSEAYVHRIGRTGRAGKKGIAISLVTNQDHKQLQVIEGIAKTKIKRAELPSADTLVELRKDGIVEEILATEVHARDRHFQEIAEKLLVQDNIEEVMVQIVKNAYSKQLNVSKFNDIKQPKTLDGNSSDEMRLFVAYGKSEGFNNQKIEEYFIEKAGVDADVFLDTYVLDEFSFITVPTEVGMIILDKFRSIKKNGREIVTKAKAKGGGGGSRGGSSRGGFGGNRGGGRDRNSGGGGRDRDRRSSGGGERSERRSSGGGERSERRSSGGGERSDRRSSGGGERRSSGDGERRSSSSSNSSDKGSSFGGFSNNYGPKKKSFNSKSRKRD
ncbi:MAG: ATP-dependent RNA helicase DeaD, partial [Planctomycetota bacterium]